MSIDYKEVFTNSNKHQHTLSLSLNNIHPSLESTLFDAKSGRYIVCFRPKGQTNYRMFGWREGAQMSIELGINESSTAYTVKFTHETIYPLFEVYSDNFDLKNKYFSSVWQPLYNISYCELNGTERTGFAIAQYVVKVNQAGQALDKNDQLISVTGLKQVAYKLAGTASDGGYEIIGTYNENGVFDGKPVKVYDETICPPNATGTITVSPTTINLNTSNDTGIFTLTSTNPWNLRETPTLVSINPNSGIGNITGAIRRNNTGGTTTVLFQNRTTREIVQVLVNVYMIKVNNNVVLNSGVQDFSIPVTAEGGSANFTFTTPNNMTITRNGNVLNCHIITPSTSTQTYQITVTHADDTTETQTINVTVNGVNNNATWIEVSRYCKLI